MSTVALIREQALQLSEDERLDLAADLLRGPDDQPSPEWERAWVEECKQRIANFDPKAARSWAEIRAGLKAQLAK